VRICLVSAEYPPMQGGVGDCTHELGRALVQLGHQVAVVTSTPKTPNARPAPGNDRAEEETASALDSHSLAPPSRSASVAGGGWPPAAVIGPASRSGLEPAVYPVVSKWNWRSWGRILQTVHTLESDILHIQYQTAGYGMHPAINFLPLRLRLVKQRPRLVATFHDLRVPYLFPKAGAVRKWVTLALAHWSDAVIATNIEDYQSLRTSLSGRPSLHLIPIGSNIDPCPPAGYDPAAWRHGLGVDEGDVLLCYFGFLNESKGGETLFRALAEVVRRGWRAKLLMIGGQVGDSDPTNVAYAKHIQALGTELGLRNHIFWTGYTDAEQVSANLFAADICVLPYRDGASYRRGSFMAALAHGLPIVSTRPRVAIDTLLDGDNIVLVPADDPLATADAIGRLASAPESRARLARGALELAQEFTWGSIAARTAEVYAGLLGE
jgi:glycosyltransferase involved in cell wall biosynthesis